MSMKIYEYPNCSTCRKALKFLESRDEKYIKHNIVERPPSKTELKKMLSHLQGELKKLFNTSGQLYRSMNIKEKLPKMTAEQALDLLAKNGKLIKRPFLLGEDYGLVGFKEAEWKEALS